MQIDSTNSSAFAKSLLKFECVYQSFGQGLRNGVDISFYVDHSRNEGWEVIYKNNFSASYSTILRVFSAYALNILDEIFLVRQGLY